GALIGCTKTAESEVYEPSGKLNPGQKFIVVLTNADLSFSGTLQIGCRTWPVLDFQEATTTALENADITSGVLLPSYFTDLDSEGRDLIFSLNEITGDTGCPAETTDTRSKGVSTTPTLRVGFGDRAILDGGIHGTRAQCVLGLHDPRDKACYSDEEVLSNAEAALDGIRDDDPWLYGATSHGGTGDDCQQFSGLDITEVPDYIRDPSRNLHVTPVPSEEGTGYRWRNGALTVQLLAVNNDHTAAFSLQDKANLPVKGRKRFGGTFAQAFTVVTEGSGAKAVDIVETQKELNESGMLYEASMFWHYSHLNDGLRNLDPDSSSTPQDTPCYGGDAYKGALAKESGGLTLGEYQFLTDPLLDECENFQPPDEDPEAVCDLERFAQLLAEIDSLEGDELEAALLEMAQLIAGNELLETYASYRDYAPGHVPEQHLLPWDVNQSDTDADQSDLDATPAKVISIETIDLETKGLPIFGSSIIWTDIKQ
ncbi:MAG: hypothetical protein OEU44_06075, partial [Gammaproteobacteria bacterium]|nr:hypothetical protein [Gammaproteobacteria bacterium]